MKRIGTISAAAGFIFLGVWMIINQANPYLGEMVFKWWPVIIILLGVELLTSFNRKDADQKIRFNALIIPVILIFLFVNVFKDLRANIGKGLTWINDNGNFNKVVDILQNIDENNYKVIDTSKTFDVSGNNLMLNIDNGEVTVYKSEDQKIKLSAKVYVSKNSSEDNYEINEQKSGDGSSVTMDESFIKKVKLNLYVPDGLKLKFEGKNLSLVSDYEFLSTKYEVKANNVNIDIKKVERVDLVVTNGKIDLADVNAVFVKSSNAAVNVDGKVEFINLDIDNGVVSVDNEISKKVNISLDSGTVKMDTDDQNIDVRLQLDHGPCVLNKDKRINSGISETFGNGENKVDISVDNGMVTFHN